MTRDDIIRLARDAGLTGLVEADVIENFERFAALVAEAERERLNLNTIHTCHAECQRPLCVLLRQEAAYEREQCALVAESYEPTCESCPSGVANAIRGRGKL
jgi:hypothetical protein